MTYQTGLSVISNLTASEISVAPSSRDAGHSNGKHIFRKASLLAISLSHFRNSYRLEFWGKRSPAPPAVPWTHSPQRSPFCAPADAVFRGGPRAGLHQPAVTPSVPVALTKLPCRWG